MADFQQLWEKFEGEDIRVVAGSVDPLEKARETVERLGLAYPVAYGLDARRISRQTGAYYQAEKLFLHAAGFIIRPDGNVEIACYSSGAVGRLAAGDVFKLVTFYKQQAEGRG